MVLTSYANFPTLLIKLPTPEADEHTLAVVGFANQCKGQHLFIYLFLLLEVTVMYYLKTSFEPYLS